MKTRSSFVIRYKWWILSAILLAAPNFFNLRLHQLATTGYSWEKFDSKLVERLRTVDDILIYVDSTAKKKGITSQVSLEYAVELDNVIKSRFYHGYSHYNFRQNWMAAASSLVWDDLSAIVIPDDILHYPMAACSQQSIVLMECFRRRGINYRKVTFKHHYAVEGLFSGKWFYFDPNLEPQFSQTEFHNSDSSLIENQINHFYRRASDSIELQKALSAYKLGAVNASPAPEAYFFHTATWILSKAGWIIPVLIAVMLERRKKRRAGSKLKKRALKTQSVTASSY